MKTTLKEVSIETFFIHNHQIKYKKDEKNSQSWIAPISINLSEDSIYHFFNNSNYWEFVKENKEISLLNRENWELYLFQNGNVWFLLDPKDFEILNFSALNHQELNTLKKKLDLLSLNGKKYFFQGKVFLTIKEGKLIFDSIIFKKNIDPETEIEKINFLIYKELNSEKNLNEKKKNIFNSLFINNNLFFYINNIKKELDLETKNSGFDYDLWKNLNILTFCIIESDFYSALIALRSIRNLIISLIYENEFISKYSKLKSLTEDLNWRKAMFEEEKNGKIYIERKNRVIYNNEIKNLKQKIDEITAWIKKYDRSKPQSLEQMIEEVDYYQQPPLFFANETFESIINNLKNQKFINTTKVLSYIKQNFLENESEKNDWKIANYLTNNTVHKTNYDTERFENWYLNKNELDILQKTLSTYIKILKKFKKHNE